MVKEVFLKAQEGAVRFALEGNAKEKALSKIEGRREKIQSEKVEKEARRLSKEEEDNKFFSSIREKLRDFF